MFMCAALITRVCVTWEGSDMSNQHQEWTHGEEPAAVRVSGLLVFFTCLTSLQMI